MSDGGRAFREKGTVLVDLHQQFMGRPISLLERCRHRTIRIFHFPYMIKGITGHGSDRIRHTIRSFEPAKIIHVNVNAGGRNDDGYFGGGNDD